MTSQKDKKKCLHYIFLQVQELVSPDSKKLRQVLEDKLNLIRSKFDYLLEKIPQLILANKLLLDHLEQTEMLTSFKDYIPLTEEGEKVASILNLDYLRHVRSYDIEMSKVHIINKQGEGQFALVYRGNYNCGNNDCKIVAVKRLKHELSEKNATEFLMEELTFRYSICFT